MVGEWISSCSGRVWNVVCIILPFFAYAATAVAVIESQGLVFEHSKPTTGMSIMYSSYSTHRLIAEADDCPTLLEGGYWL